jgi:hypothetical protein
LSSEGIDVFDAAEREAMELARQGKIPYPKCLFDGEDCKRFCQCEIVTFGFGKPDEVLFRCPRFRESVELKNQKV